MKTNGSHVSQGTSINGRPVATELIQMHLDGDEMALDRLLRHWWPIIRIFVDKRISNPMRVEEITQETMLRVCRGISSYDIRKGGFSNWIHMIANRLAQNEYRDVERSKIRDSLYAQEELQRMSVCPFVATETQERSERLTRAIAELAPEKQEVIKFRYFCGYTCIEISKILGVTEGAVKSRLRRARENLAPKLEGRQVD